MEVCYTYSCTTLAVKTKVMILKINAERLYWKKNIIYFWSKYLHKTSYTKKSSLTSHGFDL